MKKLLFLVPFCLLLGGISYGAEIIVPDRDTIQNYIDAAVAGDTLILVNGGVYQTNQLEIDKTLTLKAEDGYTTRPIVFCNGTSGILFGDSGASVTEIGIEFISTEARYLNRVNKRDSVHLIGMYDCVVRGFDRNFIQAKDKPSYLTNIIVEDCYVYAGGGGSYELIYIDDGTVEYLRLTNSSFVTFDESFIFTRSPNVKTIIVENCNIHGRTDASNQYLFRIDGDPGSTFTLKNSIISDIKLDKLWDVKESITDTVMNVFYHNIEHDSNMVKNTWSYEDKFTKTDPKFSNGSAGALYLTEGSPALTASTTGGFIGASRWTQLPDKNTLINLVVNGNPSVLKPAFHNDSLNYTGEIPFAFGDTISVDALAVFADVPITGTGKYAWDGALELSIDVVVDGSKTFHLDLSRIPPNDDPTLKRIVIRDTADTDYIFFPGDHPDWPEFELRFPAGNPTLYTIKTDKNFEGTDVAGPDSLDVSSGSGVIKYFCTAESGRSITYTVNARTVGTGEVATLRSLMLYSPTDTFELETPPFDPGISNYFIQVPSTDTIFIDAIPTDSYASVSYEDTLLVSSNAITTTSITVTSEDGNTSQTYTIEIDVASSVAGKELMKNNIRWYHDSANEQLTLFNTEEVRQVEIYSLSGSLLIRKSVSDQNIQEISTRGLPNGMYVVRLNNSSNQVKAVKFVK